MHARTHPRPVLWAGAALVVFLLGRLLVSLPPLNNHAVERHGRTGSSAWSYMSSFEPNDDDDKYFEGKQEDGRTVRILRLKKLQGKPVTWAIVITGGGFLVTAFLTQSRRQVEKMKEKCK